MPLFVVATNIGHPDDITLRTIECIQEADLIVCEEAKPARALLKRLKLFKELFLLNEHTEPTGAAQELIPLLQAGKKLALVSDCGTPLFADPGHSLVAACHDAKIEVIPLPGPSSLMAALSISGLQIQDFYYAGFLPRKPEERKKAMARLSQFKCPVAMLEAPYRLQAMLQDFAATLPKRKFILAMKLTQEGERLLRGSAKQILHELGPEKVKAEFVLLLTP